MRVAGIFIVFFRGIFFNTIFYDCCKMFNLYLAVLIFWWQVVYFIFFFFFWPSNMKIFIIMVREIINCYVKYKVYGCIAYKDLAWTKLILMCVLCKYCRNQPYLSRLLPNSLGSALSGWSMTTSKLIGGCMGVGVPNSVFNKIGAYSHFGKWNKFGFFWSLHSFHWVKI